MTLKTRLDDGDENDNDDDFEEDRDSNMALCHPQ